MGPTFQMKCLPHRQSWQESKVVGRHMSQKFSIGIESASEFLARHGQSPVAGRETTDEQRCP